MMAILRFILTVALTLFAFGVFYTIGGSFLSDQYAATSPYMKPYEEAHFATVVYHIIQAIVVVWLFNRAVGADDIIAGAKFGAMIGLYLMATDSIWFMNLKDFPQDLMIPRALMNILNSTLVGMVLAKVYGIGRGGSRAAQSEA